jgi:leucyl aminopeptidase (aminopeptidase T)
LGKNQLVAMSTFTFSKKDFSKIATTLAVKALDKENHTRFEVLNSKSKLQVNIEIYTDVSFGAKQGNLVNVFTNYGVHQLHDCTGFVASELLGEVIFFAESPERVNAVVVEKEGGYSVYSNVDKKLINSDFAAMSPEIMMTGVSLSLIEPFLGGGEMPDFGDE